MRLTNMYLVLKKQNSLMLDTDSLYYSFFIHFFFFFFPSIQDLMTNVDQSCNKAMHTEKHPENIIQNYI